MAPRVERLVRGRARATMLWETAADGRPPARSQTLDLLLLAALCLTALVATLTAIWVVPMLLIAALAAAADDLA